MLSLHVFIYVLMGIFGLIIGSFLNVLILRMNTGRTMKGRSGCPHCGHMLSASELVPVLSFFIQRGKCKKCKSSISWQYPLVELLTAFTFALIAWRFVNTVSVQEPLALTFTLLAFAFIFSLLIVITVYDLKHFIIPDGYVYTFAALSFGLLFIDPSFTQLAVPTLVHVLAGPLAALPFAFLWLVSGGKWMGFGDAKLALGMGWFLGPYEVFSALLLAFWIGAVYGVMVLILRFVATHPFTKVLFVKSAKGFTPTPFVPKRFARCFAPLAQKVWGFTIHSEVPFAPFLVFGLVLVFFFHVDVLTFFII